MRHLEVKLEAAQQHRGRDGGLEQRELVADALARPRPKRHERVISGDLELMHPQPRRPPVGVIALPAFHLVVVKRPVPPLRVEGVRLVPQLRRTAHVVRRDEEVVGARELAAAADAGASLWPRVLLQRAADEERRRRPHPQRLGEDLLQLGHPLDILERRVPVAEHVVDLVLHHLERLGVLRERIRHPGEHGGGGLVAGDQQRDQVVAHLLVVHLLAAQVDEEAQHRRVLDLGVVLVLEVLELLGVA
mmetsp:Transcript_21258/g.48865  ORF Transcript_21258/g.48865 Transcript_21258/m.48865 type:complete len:247 (+) Transcript_21258:469-1209(+)